MKSVLATPGLPLFMTGQTVSMLGDTAMWLAADIWVKQLTNSNGAAGLVYFAFVAGTMFAPLSGVLADRVRRHRLLLWTNGVMCAVVPTLLFVHDAGQVWVVYLVMLAYGVSTSLTEAAQSALLTVMLAEDLLADANALLQTSRQILRLVAPLVGAAAFTALGGATVALLDASTFAITVVTLLFLKVDEPQPAPSKVHWARDLVIGSRHLMRTARMRQVMVAVSMAMVVFGFFNTAQFAVVGEGLHRPVTFLGVLSSAQGIGAVLAALTAGWACRRIGEGRAVGIALLIMAVGAVLLMAPTAWLVFPGIVMAGFSLPWAIVGVVTLLQRTTPKDMLGRVYGSFDLFTSTPLAVSIAAGSALIAPLGYRLLLAVMAAGVAVPALYLMTRPEQKERAEQRERAEVRP
ncbi:MFS transporter [Kitasatospora brasiliensis]|uniref:MFS transporter n=1 Tax=Kitasatospora brasiliensis TaxID=3058040 RepID=UPI00292F72CB|nr:MFS transporter [Kitasatospora sp. K002]